MRGFRALQSSKLYGEYLRRIDCEAVLEYYGAENSFEVDRGQWGVEIQHSCLLDKVEPHHNNGDRNPSARMNITKKLYVCYSYWGGDIFHLIMKMEGKEEFYEIVPLISEFLGDAVTPKADFVKEIKELFSKGQALTGETIPAYSEKVLQPWALIHPYLLEARGITPEAASRLQVGFDIDENRIIFPHWWQGKLVGWQKRSLNDPRWPQTLPDKHGLIPKYKNTTGFPKLESLYNYERIRHRLGNSVLVVESPMSVLKAESLMESEDDGLLARTIATFGAKISSFQIDLLKDFDQVYIWMDDDDAGLQASKKLVQGLHRHTQVFHIKPQMFKDLGDYNTRDEVIKMIQTAEPAILTMMGWANDEREAASRRNSGR